MFHNIYSWLLVINGNLLFFWIYSCDFTEARARRCYVKKVFLKNLQISQENSCARVSFLIKLQARLAQVLSCEFCEFVKNTFLYRTHPIAASGFINCSKNSCITSTWCYQILFRGHFVAELLQDEGCSRKFFMLIQACCDIYFLTFVICYFLKVSYCI